MKLYQGEIVVEAAKDQVAIMEGSGWSRTKPEVVEEKTGTAPVEETDDDTDAEDITESASRTVPRRKPIKKA